MSSLRFYVDEFRSVSIKSPDTEERLDLVLYRPFGYLIAKLAQFLKMTPSHLSIMGALSGMICAWYFYTLGDKTAWAYGSLLFILSGIFDSSDGQLARIANLSTPLGLIIDGICDNIVIISIYIVCSYALYPTFGLWIFLVAVVAGFGHSYQCAILDFYHREYLFFGYGKTKDDVYWNPNLDEAQNNIKKAQGFKDVIFHKLRLSWVSQQQFLSGRKPAQRLIMRDLVLSNGSDKREAFMLSYKKRNKFMLTLWRLIGTNFHTAMIICFLYWQRFDLYLVFIDILACNLFILINRKIQKIQDDKLFKDFGIPL